jgi:hypothetical protein
MSANPISSSAALLYKACEVQAAWCLRKGEFEDYGRFVYVQPFHEENDEQHSRPKIRTSRTSDDLLRANLGAPGVFEWALDVAAGIMSAAADGEASFRAAVDVIRKTLGIVDGDGHGLHSVDDAATAESISRALGRRWPAHCLPKLPDTFDALTVMICYALGCCSDKMPYPGMSTDHRKNVDDVDQGSSIAILLFMYRLCQAVGSIPLDEETRLPDCRRTEDTLYFDWMAGSSIVLDVMKRIPA